jgi:3-oxoacyl-[acyl-carrier-protein] synthase-1
MSKAIIGATSAICSIGGTSEQVWASARAGIARIGNSNVLDKHFDPIQMGLVPEEKLPPLDPAIGALGLPQRARRILRLSAPLLKAVTKELKQPVRVFVGLPEFKGEHAKWLEEFLPLLSQASAVQIDMDASAVVPRGRAAALRALESALESLDSDPATPVVVGGVDTFLDLKLLADLDAEGRLLGPHVMDGFIPGEGAAFFVLHSPTDLPSVRTAALEGVASVKDPGFRHGTSPAKGEGLADAIDMLRTQSEDSAPIATTFAGFNGENFDAKLWGVAQMRHNDFFSPQLLIEHPADKYGDAGAATGALLTVMAATALSKRQRPGPALIWAASDSEMRACALLSPVKA